MGKKKEKKKVTHLGEKKVMNCGEEVEIVGYYNYTDIDVRFPDGFVKRHAQYTNFKKGTINRPSSKRCGECRKMQDGSTATIIKYRNCNNIDVRFENGVIKKHTRYENFKAGVLKMPTVQEDQNNERCIRRVVAAEDYRLKGNLSY